MTTSINSAAYAAHYDAATFLERARALARSAGAAVIEPALKLYYSAGDADTPAWARAAVYGALGYLVLPLDVIPDFTPVVGFVDDAAVLTAAVGAVAAHIKEEHVARARETFRLWFG